MALQTSGAISLLDIQNEFGGSNPISLSEYYGAADGIPASGTISISQFYGKSAFSPISWAVNDSNYFNTNSNMDVNGVIISPYSKIFSGYNDVYLSTKTIDFYISPGFAVNYYLLPEYTGYSQDKYSVYADGVLIEETNGAAPSFSSGKDIISPIYCSVLSIRMYNGSGATMIFSQSSVSYLMISPANLVLTDVQGYGGASSGQGIYYNVQSDNRFQDSTVASGTFNFPFASKIRIAGGTSSELVADVARWYINNSLVSTTSGYQSFDVYNNNATSVSYTYTKDGSLSEGSDTTNATIFFRGAA